MRHAWRQGCRCCAAACALSAPQLNCCSPSYPPPTPTHFLRSGKRYGTTAVCALRAGNTLYVAHAGDSRAVSPVVANPSGVLGCWVSGRRCMGEGGAQWLQPAVRLGTFWGHGSLRTRLAGIVPCLHPRQLLAAAAHSFCFPLLAAPPPAGAVPRGSGHQPDARPQARLGARGAPAHRGPGCGAAALQVLLPLLLRACCCRCC